MSTIIDSNTYDSPLAFQQPTSIWPTALKWGAIGGAISCVLTLVSYNLGWMDFGPNGEPPSTWPTTVLSILAFGALIYLGLKAYRDTENGGMLTLGRAILWSLGFGLILGAIGALFSILFTTVLAPDYLSDIMDNTMAVYEEQGMTDEQIEAAEMGMGYVMNPWVMALSSLVGNVLTALVLGLIVGLILKTPAPVSSR